MHYPTKDLDWMLLYFFMISLFWKCTLMTKIFLQSWQVDSCSWPSRTTTLCICIIYHVLARLKSISVAFCVEYYPFDAHCCHMGTAIKHTVSDRVKPSFVIFDIRALWRSGLSVRVPGCQKITNDGLIRSVTECFIAVPIWQQWASKS